MPQNASALRRGNEGNDSMSDQPNSDQKPPRPPDAGCSAADAFFAESDAIRQRPQIDGACVVDGSEYRAELITGEQFGCVLFEPAA
jgi:hypothetical protein